jgi:aryl-alcohol dehydrogenase-like predicted oxidoreductase
MARIALGNTGIEVSDYCLGTMTYGNQTGQEDAFAQMDMAVDAGIDFFDTAEMYPVNPVTAETRGRTEEVIGNWLAARGGRDKLVIATKITGKGSVAIPDKAPITPARIRQAVEDSLRRLQTDYIDLYQLHWPNRGSYHFRQLWGYRPAGDKAGTLAHMTEVLETLADLIRAGKIRHVGLSNETAWGTAQWLGLADAHGLPRMASIQNEYSLLCRYFDSDLAEVSVNETLPLLAYSPLAAGLLTGKYAGDVTPEPSRRAVNPDLGGRITPRVFAAVSGYLGLAQEAGLDPVQMALAWTRTRHFVTIPIIGATTADQLAQQLPAMEMTLSPDLLRAIDTMQRAHPMPF